MLLERGGAGNHEDDLSAKNQTESEGSRLQSQNEYSGRKKGTGSKKSEGKKEIVRIGRSDVAFFSLWPQTFTNAAVFIEKGFLNDGIFRKFEEK